MAAVISQLIETNQQIQKRLQQVKPQLQQQTAQVKPTNRQPLVEPLTRISKRDFFDQHLAKRSWLGPQATECVNSNETPCQPLPAPIGRDGKAMVTARPPT